MNLVTTWGGGLVKFREGGRGVKIAHTIPKRHLVWGQFVFALRSELESRKWWEGGRPEPIEPIEPH